MCSCHWNFIFWRNTDAADCNSKFHLCHFFKKIVTVAFWQISLLWVLWLHSFSFPRIFQKVFYLFLFREKLCKQGTNLLYFFQQCNKCFVYIMSNNDKKKLSLYVSITDFIALFALLMIWANWWCLLYPKFSKITRSWDTWKN